MPNIKTFTIEGQRTKNSIEKNEKETCTYNLQKLYKHDQQAYEKYVQTES